MLNSASSMSALHLKPILVALAVVALVVIRRLRPQRVRPLRALSIAILVTLSAAFALLETGQVGQEWLALALSPVFLIVGVWLGLKLMSTVTFWRDEASGQLWMRGGMVYVAVWLGTLALRIALRVLALRLEGSAAHGNGSLPQGIAVLSADPLVLSVGLWLGRAVAIFKEVRSSEASSARPAVGT